MTPSQPLVSSMLSADLTSVLADLSTVDYEQKTDMFVVWRFRLLSALLPAVIYLEQAGKPPSATEIFSLPQLDALIDRSLASAGAGFKVAASMLTDLLKVLPGYEETNRGAQPAAAEEMFAFMAMGIRTRQLLALPAQA
jgi:hypothetical protein